MPFLSMICFQTGGSISTPGILLMSRLCLLINSYQALPSYFCHVSTLTIFFPVFFKQVICFLAMLVSFFVASP